MCWISREAPRAVVSLVCSFERKVLPLKKKKVPYPVTVMTTIELLIVQSIRTLP